MILKAITIGKNILRYGFLLVMPYRCLICRKEKINNHICDTCISEFKRIENNYCFKCGIPHQNYQQNNSVAGILPLADIRKQCVKCLNGENKGYIARSTYIYNDFIAKAVFSLKYQDFMPVSKLMATLMLTIITDSHFNTRQFDIICAVPMSRKSLRSRMYNQAALLSKQIYKGLDCANNLHLPDLLIKIKETIKQTKLDREQRKINIKGSIALNERYRHLLAYKKTILIIDDIITTGSTINECCRIIKAINNECKVYCLTFARTIL